MPRKRRRWSMVAGDGWKADEHLLAQPVPNSGPQQGRERQSALQWLLRKNWDASTPRKVRGCRGLLTAARGGSRRPEASDTATAYMPLNPTEKQGVNGAVCSESIQGSKRHGKGSRLVLGVRWRPAVTHGGWRAAERQRQPPIPKLSKNRAGHDSSGFLGKIGETRGTGEAQGLLGFATGGLGRPAAGGAAPKRPRLTNSRMNRNRAKGKNRGDGAGDRDPRRLR